MELVESTNPDTLPSVVTWEAAFNICEKYNLDYDESCRNIIESRSYSEDLSQTDVFL